MLIRPPSIAQLRQVAHGASMAGNAIVKGFESAGSWISKHPVQTGIIAATAVGLGAAAVFTGGADLAAAPDVIGAELGPASVTMGVFTTDAADTAAVSADAAAAGGESTTVAADTAGTESTAATAGRNFASGLAKTAGTIAKYGVAPLAITSLLGEGLTVFSKGLDNVYAALTGYSVQLPYVNPFGSGTMTGSGASSSTPSSEQQKPINLLDILLIGGAVVAVVYIASRS